MITAKEGADLAMANGLEYFECSAVRKKSECVVRIQFCVHFTSIFDSLQKEMQNVDQPFLHLAKAWCDMYREKVESMKALAV